MPTTTITPRNADKPDDLTFNVTVTDERGNITGTWIDLHELIVAANAALDMLDEAATDVATAFACGEADTIAALFRAAGRNGDDFLAAHGTDDDEGDAHYKEDPEDAAHREAGKCRWVSPSGFRCGWTAEDSNGYCSTHAHLAND